MPALPPTEAATKADVGNLREDMRANFDEVRAEMRTEFKNVREEMRTEFKNVREEMRAMEARINERIDLKVETSEHRVVAALRKEFVAQTRVFVFSTLTAVVTVGGLAVTAGRVG